MQILFDPVRQETREHTPGFETIVQRMEFRAAEVPERFAGHPTYLGAILLTGEDTPPRQFEMEFFSAKSVYPITSRNALIDCDSFEEFRVAIREAYKNASPDLVWGEDPMESQRFHLEMRKMLEGYK